MPGAPPTAKGAPAGYAMAPTHHGYHVIHAAGANGQYQVISPVSPLGIVVDPSGAVVSPAGHHDPSVGAYAVSSGLALQAAPGLA